MKKKIVGLNQKVKFKVSFNPENNLVNSVNLFQQLQNKYLQIAKVNSLDSYNPSISLAAGSDLIQLEGI